MKTRTRIIAALVAVTLAFGVTLSIEWVKRKSYTDQWAQVAEEARDSGNSYFARVMDDGRMDLAEYEATVELIVTCVNQEFPEPMSPPYEAVRDKAGVVDHFMFTATAELMDTGIPEREINRCRELYAGSAMTLFLRQYRDLGSTD